MELGESDMKGIYSRTFTVQDDKLNEAMEICKGLAEVRKVHFPESQSYFSFQEEYLKEKKWEKPYLYHPGVDMVFCKFCFKNF